MGLIPVLLLLSNCKALLRENIDLLLIKSNYIFFPLCISRDFTMSYSVPAVCTVHSSFNMIEKYYTSTVTDWCSL